MEWDDKVKMIQLGNQRYNSDEAKSVFRYFIRKVFADVAGDLTNVEIDELGIEFHQYLNNILSEDQQERILPKNPLQLVMEEHNPLKTHGFEPAYVLHFTRWISEQAETENL